MWFGHERRRPPTKAEAFLRALALLNVTSYAMVIPPRDQIKNPADLSPEDLAEFTSSAEKMRDEFWSKRRGYTAELSPREREFAQTTMLTMTARQQVDASWRLESFQVLLWALGMHEGLPEWNERAGHDLAKMLPAAMVPKFLAMCSLRPRAELERARSTAEVWHWRSRTRQLIDAGRKFDPNPEMPKAGLVSFDAIVRLTARKLKESGELAQIVDEDFAVGGKAYRDLSAEEFAEVTSITVERHFALNWLCGIAPGNRWDETPTGT